MLPLLLFNQTIRIQVRLFLFSHSIDHVVSLLGNFTYTDYIEKLLPFFFNIVTNRISELKKRGMKLCENKIKHSQMPQGDFVFIGI